MAARSGVSTGFNPALEGMRAIAAIGVLTTHVAFQTRSSAGVFGAVWGRLDLAVAVFFALSGFLLWRSHALAARGGRPAMGIRRYLRHRIIRIWPAYVVVVVATLVLLPEAHGVGVGTWLANLTLTQVFVPYSLAPGLTQMWSLSVEISFYLALPGIAIAMRRLRGSAARWRIPAILAVMVLSLGWAPLAHTWALVPGLSATLWLPGYVPWFGVGMVLGELAATPTAANGLRRLSTHRPLMAIVAAVAYAASCTPIAGPTTLDAVSPQQFMVKTALGAIVAYSLIAPLVFVPHRAGLLSGAGMQTLGRWSYALFIWHVSILAALFPLLGSTAFGAPMWLVWPITLLAAVAVSAASYGLIEEPIRAAMRRRERRSIGESTDHARSAATPITAGALTHQSKPT